MTTYKYGKSSLRRLEGVHPTLVKIAHEALKESKYDISIISGLRTTEEQQEMFKRGVSEADGINTRSAHQDGLAIDILPWVKLNGKLVDMYDYSSLRVRDIWAEVHRSFLRVARLNNIELELGWTYIMKDGKYDYPHIQLKLR
jgi:hypothetical protein